MSSLKQDITALYPEQKDLIDMFVKTSYKHSYYDTFTTLLDYFIHQFTAPQTLSQHQTPFDFKSSYSADEQALFEKMRIEIQRLCKKYCSLWAGVKDWYDPFGCLFENVCSNSSKQRQGQFFTPEPLCNLIAQVSINPPSEKIGGTCLDPCCGSGRLLLAANAINPSLYYVANDIDSLCVKMSAINMCLNGVIGEVSCNDGLWATDKNFRFAFKVVPMVSLFADSIAFLLMNFTHDIKKTYCLIPLEFDNCMYKHLPQEQQKAHFEHVKAHVEFRETIHPEGLQGVLFDTEDKQKVQPRKPKAPTKTPKSLDDIKINPILFNL
jgi:type I restriction enzyme M protein